MKVLVLSGKGMFGTYGVVLKCRHKVTKQIVAIKKFKESDDDKQVKKTASREIRILRQLQHDNIVNLLEVFRVKAKLYLVFEYVERTILEEIEQNPEGLDADTIKWLMWQLLRAIEFCHQHDIMHRDVKPENLLVSRDRILKLCDFGFARSLVAEAKYTEYVSTRWYRAPELLVGDVMYGKAVDIWAIGCMFAEINTGMPLFPGESDIDQLHQIMKCTGTITPRQRELFQANSMYQGIKLPDTSKIDSLEQQLSSLEGASMDFLKCTIQVEPMNRWTCSELLQHAYFEGYTSFFEDKLQILTAKKCDRNTTIKTNFSNFPLKKRSSANDNNQLHAVQLPALHEDATKGEVGIRCEHQTKTPEYTHEYNNLRVGVMEGRTHVHTKSVMECQLLTSHGVAHVPVCNHPRKNKSPSLSRLSIQDAPKSNFSSLAMNTRQPLGRNHAASDDERIMRISSQAHPAAKTFMDLTHSRESKLRSLSTLSILKDVYGKPRKVQKKVLRRSVPKDSLAASNVS
uniref:Cyclin-dependent kinase 2 homolog n=1 Tax=Albugo laibachii Nc14 TaxID=890382 RepID=F0W5Q6_9STRA|nr:cyclindependent kinaselike putative [Albugo laibachii Nc14]|eukprot:CCA16447.1 cyclindependent kinaselike putative [Albugo laibachii Nc14]